MFEFLKRRKRVPLLSDWLPHETWMGPQAFVTSDGTVCAAFEVEGLGFEAEDTNTINARTRALNDVWRNIASDRLTVIRKWHHGVDDGLGAPRISDGPGRELLEAYYRNLSDLCLYRNRLFLFLEWRPPKVAGEWLSDKIQAASSKEDVEEAAEERLAHLERVCALLQEQLRDYGLRRLGMRERNGEFGCYGVFDEIAEVEALLATGIWRPVPVTTGRIGNAILSEDVTFHHEHVEIRGPGHTVYAANLGFKDYPAKTWAGMLNSLLSAEFTFTLVQSFSFLEYGQAESVLTRKQNKAKWIGDKALSQIAALSNAVDEMASGAFVLGQHNLTLCVFSTSEATQSGFWGLNDVVNSAWRRLGSCGCVVARENKALMAAWLSMFSGNGRYRVRPGYIASRNDVAMNPFFAFPIGPEVSRWGRPILLTRTSGGTPHRLHWHDGAGDSATGNTFITGQIGSGKTSGAGLKIAATANSIVPKGGGWIGLDHKRGWHALTLYLGGSYMIMGDGEPNLAQMKALDDTPRNREHLNALLRGCIRHGDWRDLEPEEDRLLALGIATVMQNDPKDRWVGEVQAFLDGTEAGARLLKWCWGQDLGWVIDAPEDKVDLSGDINCFDTTRLLSNPRARGPAITALFHRISLRLDGRPVLISADEAWHVLETEEMEGEVNKAVRTIRSKNGSMVLISQDPADANRSHLSQTLVRQCPNQFHYANDQASDGDYRDVLKMRDGAIAAVKRLRKGSGQFLLRKGGDCSVQQIPMHGMSDWLAVLSASENDLNALDRIPEHIRRDPKLFLPEYHRLRREMRQMETTP